MVLFATVTVTARGQTTCDDIWQNRIDMVWGQADAAFHAGKTAADEVYRQEFQAANATYEQALARADAAFDGLYWALMDARYRDQSPVAAPIADAVTERAHDRNMAHRAWVSSVSDMITRWSESIEKAELVRSVFVGEKVLLVEQQLSDCR